MNTSPKQRRYQKPPARNLQKNDIYVGTIDDPVVAKAFAQVMTSFVYLEERMASVLAVLLGGSDKVAAAFVLKAIKSPTGRIDVMKALLEKAPINKDLGAEYDHILREFGAMSAERNAYAHGKWWTDFNRKKTILDETDDPTTALHVRREVTAEALETLDKRMLTLHIAIHEGPEAELRKRREKLVLTGGATRSASPRKRRLGRKVS